jgi:ribosomal 50S subunit-associated protein YjgA (DUF615 family)
MLGAATAGPKTKPKLKKAVVKIREAEFFGIPVHERDNDPVSQHVDQSDQRNNQHVFIFYHVIQEL